MPHRPEARHTRRSNTKDPATPPSTHRTHAGAGQNPQPRKAPREDKRANIQGKPNRKPQPRSQNEAPKSNAAEPHWHRHQQWKPTHNRAQPQREPGKHRSEKPAPHATENEARHPTNSSPQEGRPNRPGSRPAQQNSPQNPAAQKEQGNGRTQKAGPQSQPPNKPRRQRRKRAQRQTQNKPPARPNGNHRPNNAPKRHAHHLQKDRQIDVHNPRAPANDENNDRAPAEDAPTETHNKEGHTAPQQKQTPNGRARPKSNPHHDNQPNHSYRKKKPGKQKQSPQPHGGHPNKSPPHQNQEKPDPHRPNRNNRPAEHEAARRGSDKLPTPDQHTQKPKTDRTPAHPLTTHNNATQTPDNSKPGSPQTDGDHEPPLHAPQQPPEKKNATSEPTAQTLGDQTRNPDNAQPTNHRSDGKPEAHVDPRALQRTDTAIKHLHLSPAERDVGHNARAQHKHRGHTEQPTALVNKNRRPAATHRARPHHPASADSAHHSHDDPQPPIGHKNQDAEEPEQSIGPGRPPAPEKRIRKDRDLAAADHDTARRHQIQGGRCNAAEPRNGKGTAHRA